MFFNKISLSRYFIEKHKLLISPFVLLQYTSYYVNMVSVTSAARYITSASSYHPRYQSKSSMYIRCLIPRNLAELVEAVSIEITISKNQEQAKNNNNAKHTHA